MKLSVNLNALFSGGGRRLAPVHKTEQLGEFIDLKSSNLAGIQYEEETRLLRVFFTNGGVYDYSSVPPETVERLVISVSPGRYFHHTIRGAYRSEKVADSSTPLEAG